ncbi:hypothetical protein NIIDMKKI_19890 [Mycobacterium kansasii]|uniref:Uncharacterized protein n=1 Tax=Mycobacterium kansasii TaxID=1768 RepID=A0A7G1I8Z7_MYCKA|nr:hypothetical protein NIIDMKKI_19890 [Mycobacterium kansasii]
MDRMLPRCQVRGLVAGELQGTAGEVDELVVIHRDPVAIECGLLASNFTNFALTVRIGCRPVAQTSVVTL